jgi:hypothetical protein
MAAGLREALTTLLRDSVLSAPFQAKAEEDCYIADAAHGEALAEAIQATLEAIRAAQARVARG